MTIERFIDARDLLVPRTRSFTVVAQDPSISVSTADPRVLTGQAEIPAERYLPGPRRIRFQEEGLVGELERAPFTLVRTDRLAAGAAYADVELP